MRKLHLIVGVGFLTLAGVANADSLSMGGSWKSERSKAIQGRWSATFQETAEGVLRGSVTLTGSNVVEAGQVQGTLSNGRLMFGVLAGDDVVASFDGELVDGKIRGTWTSGPLNDSGLWEGSIASEGTGSESGQ